MLSSPLYRPFFALFFVALFAYMLRKTIVEIRPAEERAALFPMVLGVPCLVLALLAFGQELFYTLRRSPARINNPEVSSSLARTVIRNRAISIVAWTLGFFLAIWLLGFLIAVPVTIFLYLRFAGGEKWSLSIVLSLVAGEFLRLVRLCSSLAFSRGSAVSWLNLIG